MTPQQNLLRQLVTLSWPVCHSYADFHALAKDTQLWKWLIEQLPPEVFAPTDDQGDAAKAARLQGEQSQKIDRGIQSVETG